MLCPVRYEHEIYPILTKILSKIGHVEIARPGEDMPDLVLTYGPYRYAIEVKLRISDRDCKQLMRYKYKYDYLCLAVPEEYVKLAKKYTNCVIPLPIRKISGGPKRVRIHYVKIQNKTRNKIRTR